MPVLSLNVYLRIWSNLGFISEVLLDYFGLCLSHISVDAFLKYVMYINMWWFRVRESEMEGGECKQTWVQKCMRSAYWGHRVELCDHDVVCLCVQMFVCVWYLSTAALCLRLIASVWTSRHFYESGTSNTVSHHSITSLSVCVSFLSTLLTSLLSNTLHKSLADIQPCQPQHRASILLYCKSRRTTVPVLCLRPVFSLQVSVDWRGTRGGWNWLPEQQ